MTSPIGQQGVAAMTRLRKCARMVVLAAMSLATSWSMAQDNGVAGIGAAQVADPTPPRNMGGPGEVGKGPIVDAFSFEGNNKVTSAELAQIVRLKPGMPLSAALVQPDLERITAYYRDHGGAYVQPSIVENALNHVRVIFQVHEGVKWHSAGSVPQPAPKFLDAYWDNTMVCAAAQTGNDLCHMWLMKDGSFIIFDPNGVHRGRWQAGKVMADGRVPLCRHWEGQTVQLPPEIVAAKGNPYGGLPRAPGAPQPARICKVVDFQMQCTTYPDVQQLTDEQKRIASLGMVERNKEIGSCYSHGPHQVGDVWFEWDDYAPGQLGLDRQMLLPGHQ